MHWLAARYQRPGYVSQINLWFCGKRGTGKGSLLSILRMVFGSKSIGKIDASDIDRGWSDSLYGADFIEWDEFKSTGWRDLNRMIKEKTGNESFLTTTRSVGSTLQPFVAGQIMSTNDTRPMFVEEDDRQNSFIRTAGSEEWKLRANALWLQDTNEIVDTSIPSGFAAFLNAVEVDYAFIRRPLSTAFRAELVDHFADDSIEQWIADAVDSGTVFENPSYSELHHSYRDFVRDHLAIRAKDIKTFRGELKEKNLVTDTVRKTAERKSYRCLVLSWQRDHRPDLEVVHGGRR